MKTSQQVEAAFVHDLQKLLNKYKVSIEFGEWRSGNKHVRRPFLSVEIPEKRNKNGNVLSEFASFYLLPFLYSNEYGGITPTSEDCELWEIKKGFKDGMR